MTAKPAGDTSTDNSRDGLPQPLDRGKDHGGHHGHRAAMNSGRTSFSIAFPNEPSPSSPCSALAGAPSRATGTAHRRSDRPDQPRRRRPSGEQPPQADECGPRRDRRRQGGVPCEGRTRNGDGLSTSPAGTELVLDPCSHLAARMTGTGPHETGPFRDWRFVSGGLGLGTSSPPRTLTGVRLRRPVGADGLQNELNQVQRNLNE